MLVWSYVQLTQPGQLIAGNTAVAEMKLPYNKGQFLEVVMKRTQ